MSWHLTETVGEFLAQAEDFVRSERVRNTVLLTVAARLNDRGAPRESGSPPLLGWWRDSEGDDVRGAFVVTSPSPMMLTAMPDDAVAGLAEELSAAGYPLAGINAEERSAERFAEVWKARTGADSRVFRRMRLFRLGELVWPSPMPAGKARVVMGADRDLLISWFEAFAHEVTEPDTDHGAAADDRISYGGMTVWEVDGAPVSIAGVSRTVDGMVRVGPVYTPPGYRGEGYAGAATAVVSQAALDAGITDVLLYTDLANPTSNALYQRMGFVPVEDRLVLSFG